MSKCALTTPRKAKKSLWLTLFLILLYLDLLLTGSGFWSIDFFGFSFRRTAFFLIWGASLYCAVSKPLKLNGLLCLSVVFIPALLAYQLFVMLIDHDSFLYFINEAIPIFFLVTSPLVAVSLVDLIYTRSLMFFISFFATISASVHLILLVLLKFENQFFLYPIINYINIYLRNPSAEVADNIVIGFFSWSEFRVFWASSLMMFCGLISSLFLLRGRYKKKSILSFLYSLSLLICIFGILATGIRAFQVAVLLMCIFLSGRYFVHMLGFKIKISALTAMLIFSLALFLIHLSLNPSFLATIGIGRPESDNIRFAQFGLIFEGFLNNPGFGLGLGTTFSSIRSSSSPWTYELALLSVAAKIGMVGCTVVLIYTYAIVRFIFSRHSEYHGFWFLLLLSLTPVFSTNSFLFSSMGVGLLLICFVEGFYNDNWR